MEYVPLSTTVLDQLAKQDCRLRPSFRGVFAADRLPRQSRDGAYIVNTDPHDKPGRHWLGLWVDRPTCQVFDSYGLPLRVYDDPDLQLWLSQFPTVLRSDKTLQTLDSMACGHYALQYLKSKANGVDMNTFLSFWSDTDFVQNDLVVGHMTDLSVVDTLRHPGDQCNVTCRDACCTLGQA